MGETIQKTGMYTLSEMFGEGAFGCVNNYISRAGWFCREARDGWRKWPEMKGFQNKVSE